MKVVSYGLFALTSISLLGGCQKSNDSAIEKWVSENPEKIIKSLQAYEMKRQEESQPKPAMVKDNSEALFKNTGSPVAGNPDGKVEIAYFFDFRCGHCARQSKTFEEVLSKRNDVKVVYKVFPVLGPASEVAARAALAAHQQGKFKEFYHELYKTRDMTPDAMKKIAGNLKMDLAQFEKDQTGEAVNKELAHVDELAQKMKVSGTPFLAIAPDKVFPGRVDQLGEIINTL